MRDKENDMIHIKKKPIDVRYKDKTQGSIIYCHDCMIRGIT